ncbi:preprotein translocase, SecA subunit [Beggiatoa alba B18LD]|uniref:Protein translocase subunit SecA n=1 Tax=Beggiatoa alba B18LD TaxID=395493 RepID=I3CJE6_9GAMM|nr:preprotein translocase subunit SecA [Beggiatoa alba]EIJ43739.1 preprotein translocase, SecA subunit [Beggiatoa alba B18LD]
MLGNLLKKIFGSRNERLVKRMMKTVEQINALESDISRLSDDELRHKTVEFRERLAKGATLDDLLPEAFAVVRETGKRVLNMRHFDVQLIGGMVLHHGKIAEMRTGEGKTLMATLPAYLNALSGLGVHIVTVNDYLARRDAEWMGRIYRFLGMSVGVIVPNMAPEEKREAYTADITYGTNNEFGFDYLRDNMAFSVADRMQRKLNYAIVDEVDSILIDEARTPLIISGPTDDNSELYQHINRIVPQLKPQAREPHKDDEEEIPGDYYVDEKAKQVLISDEGHQHIEELLMREGLLSEGESLYDSANISKMHHVHAALRAHTLFQRNVDYIVKDGQIIIVDEFTGRTMPGRRWSEGLHQAVEAKEGVPVQNENQTLASITFQNLFRLYKKLSGMTGTADTEAYEFQQIYGLEVVVIPTHRPMVRKDMGDLVYLTKQEKYKAILTDIQDCQKRGQPVLVGTASIESSETLSQFLTQEGIQHQVLNAKYHEQEAYIIAQAGRVGAVTIATNMAGRGTDIILGGNVEIEIQKLRAEGLSEEELQAKEVELRTAWKTQHQAVLDSGGLHIIGTERHESRRIDNQLRGRSGRQGDNGSSRFYLSLEDNLMRIFASDRITGLMQKLGMEAGEAIEHPWVSKAIENAQRKVEGRNFDIRKQLLEYDDVANDQRKVVYEQRNELMESENVYDTIRAIRLDVLNEIIDTYIPPQSLDEQWNVEGLEKAIEETFGAQLPIRQWLDEDHELHEASLRQKIADQLEARYLEKEQLAGAEVLRHFEKAVMLQLLDSQWKEHLAAMDYLRQGIHLRGYAQKNPKQEYKREAFEMFSKLLERFKQEVVGMVSKVHIRTQAEVDAVEEERRKQAAALASMQFQHAQVDGLTNELTEVASPAEEATENKEQASHTPYVRQVPKVGRNEPCPCGSGKKYKQCHGKLD